MLHVNGKKTCDCEIGSVKKGWRTCGKPAAVESHREYAGAHYSLHFCKAHIAKASLIESKHLVIHSVKPIDK